MKTSTMLFFQLFLLIYLFLSLEADCESGIGLLFPFSRLAWDIISQMTLAFSLTAEDRRNCTSRRLSLSLFCQPIRLERQNLSTNANVFNWFKKKLVCYSKFVVVVCCFIKLLLLILNSVLFFVHFFFASSFSPWQLTQNTSHSSDKQSIFLFRCWYTITNLVIKRLIICHKNLKSICINFNFPISRILCSFVAHTLSLSSSPSSSVFRIDLNICCRPKSGTTGLRQSALLNNEKLHNTGH